MFKKIKYNIVFVLAALIVTSAILLNVFVFKEETRTFVPPSSDENLIPGPSGDDVIGDDNNPGGDENEGDSGEVDLNVPSIAYPLQVVSYALNKTYGASSYISKFNVDMENTATVAGSKITVSQKTEVELRKNGDISTEIGTFSATGAMSDKAANYIRYFYYRPDGVVEFGITPDGNYDLNNAKVEELTVQGYYDRFSTSNKDVPAVTFNQNTVKRTGETRVSNGTKYYYIVLTVSDLSAISPKFGQYYAATGQLKNIVYKALTFKFYVYKDSGYIFRLDREERFEAVNPGTGFDLDVTLNESRTFTNINAEVEITPPRG